jgi:hypothetical protein
MHNLVRECSISFNDLTEARFDNYHLDFWTAFTLAESKRNGYGLMVGNAPELTDPLSTGAGLGPAAAIPAATLNLPLILPHTRDSGVALPTAALPYNEMRINFNFRDWTELLIYDDTTGGTQPPSRPALSTDLLAVPTLTNVQVWANYAIVSNDERKRMGKAPRDILIEQVQTAPRQVFAPATNNTPSFDVRFSHAIKVLFFAVRNTTNGAEWSNYTAAFPVPGPTAVNFAPSNAFNPILTASVVYENTSRLSNMGADYYTLVVPYYNAVAIPRETGLHCYSYSLDFYNIMPMGATNYGKLTNVSVGIQGSPQALVAANGSGAVGSGANTPNTFEFVLTCVNNNIIRISGFTNNTNPNKVKPQNRIKNPVSVRCGTQHSQIQGKPLELLVPSRCRKMSVALGKTQGYGVRFGGLHGYNLRDWAILSQAPKPALAA